jgi:hypothetical protein
MSAHVLCFYLFPIGIHSILDNVPMGWAPRITNPTESLLTLRPALTGGTSHIDHKVSTSAMHIYIIVADTSGEPPGNGRQVRTPQPLKEKKK